MKKILFVLLMANCSIIYQLRGQNTFPSSGSVGIGTTNPQYLFEVNGGFKLNNSNVNGYGYILSNRLNIGGSNGDYTGNGLIQFAPPIGSSLVINYTNTYNARWTQSFNGGNMQWQNNNGNTVFFADYLGRVGIGTTIPQSKLSIYESGSSNNQWKGRVDFGGDNARIVAGEYNGTAYFGAHNSALNAWANLAINVDGGFVGIGTKSPTEKLCVNGNIKTKKLIVTQLGWADYVFAPTYKLLSLQDLETYIKAHQHLPNVPSASEVAANGIDLGDTQAILLKKIEELTLYVIAQEKELKIQKEEIKKLKKNGSK